jgi:hypothetical protein
MYTCGLLRHQLGYARQTEHTPTGAKVGVATAGIGACGRPDRGL